MCLFSNSVSSSANRYAFSASSCNDGGGSGYVSNSSADLNDCRRNGSSDAESNHTDAESNHTDAESDHTDAESDHTDAESDHTDAESDHTDISSTRSEDSYTDDNSNTETDSNNEESDSDGNGDREDDESDDGWELQEDILDGELFNFQDLNRPIAPNNPITVGEAVLVLETFYHRHNCSYKEQENLLEVIKYFLGPSSILPDSLDAFNSPFLPIQHQDVNYFFYCKNCSNLLGGFKKINVKNQIVKCKVCHNQSPVNCAKTPFFIIFNLKSKFRTFLEDVSENVLKYEDIRLREFDGKMRDIYDGKSYRKLTLEGEVLHDEFNYSFNVNVDGASVFHNSKTSCWPIQILLNELSVDIRFKRIMCAGLWFGLKCIDMGLFLKPFTEAVNKIGREGVDWTDHRGQRHNSKIVLHCCSVDTVARPKVMCSTAFCGKYGCPWCLDPGIFVADAYRFPSSVILNGKRVSRIFPKRTEEMVKNAMLTAATSGSNSYGYKGLSPFFSCTGFNLLWGFPIDSLHGFYLGTFGRTCLDALMKHTRAEYYIGTPTKISLMNKRMQNLKLPKEVHRLICPIETYGTWKASQLKTFLLHYAFPLFQGILKDKYLNHLALLIEGVSLLNQEITVGADLEKSHRLLTLYVKNVPILYSEREGVYNVHLLLHAAHTVNEDGPMWSISTFPYEANMKNLKYCVHGAGGVAQQIANKIVIHDSLGHLQRGIQMHPRTESVMHKLSSKIPLAHRAFRLDDDVVVFGKAVILGDDEIRILSQNGVPVANAVYYKKIIYRNTVYTVNNYKPQGKRDNSYVVLDPVDYGRITHFVVAGRKCYIILERLIVHRIKFSGNDSFSYLLEVDVRQRNEILVVRPERLFRKCFYMPISKEKAYISRLLNTFEVQ